MKAIAWAFNCQEKPGPKWVLVCLAWHADKTTWKAKPGIPLLVRETGLKERAVSQHLDALEQSGLISRERRYVPYGPAKGKRMSDQFVLLATDPALSANSADTVPAKSATSDNGVTRTIRHDNPQISTSQPADSASAYIRIEPSKEPNVEPSRPADDVDDKIESYRILSLQGGPLGDYAKRMMRDLQRAR